MAQARDEAGNIWEVDAQGNAVRLIQAAGSPPPQQKGTVYTPPPKPEPRKTTYRVLTAQEAQDMGLPPGSYKMSSEGEVVKIAGVDPAAPGSTPDVTAKIRADALTQFGGARMIGSAQTDLISAYKKGPGKTSGIKGLWDYLPGVLSERNQRFDKAGEGIQGRVVKALGLTGGSVNSMPEAKMWTGPYVPTSSDRDGTTRDGIDRLSPLRESAARDSVSILGGVPDLDGTIHPIGSPRANQILASIGLTPDLKAMPNVWDQPSADHPANQAMEGSIFGAGKAAIGQGRTRYQRDPQVQKQVAAAFRRGASYEQLSAISEAAGYGPLDPSEFARAEEARRKGQGGGVSFNIGKDVPVTFMDEVRGSPTGAGLAGIANAGSFGALQRLAPEQMQAIQDLNPKMSLAGEVIGSIGGTSMVGKLGQGIAGRLGGIGSKLATGGGRGGNFARGVGTDAAYAGIYGENTGQGALPSAGLGALGSVGGRAIGGTLGKGLGGFQRAIGAETLVDRGIPLTTGQHLGGMAKSFEDRLTGVPMVGDVVNARRTEGFEGLQRSLQNEAGAPIGARFDGGDWREALPDQFGQAYDDATAGVNVPLDDTFRNEMMEISGRQMPDDYAAAFDAVGMHRVNPAVRSGALTGDSYQQAMRGISAAKSKASSVGVSGFEDVYRGNLSDMQASLRGQMERGGGSQVVEGLGKADKAYRMAKVIQDAQTRAAGGSLSGVPGLPAPSQFLAASTANAKKFDGKRPFGQILDAAQQVMPSKIGDSGTAGRLAQMALPAALVGGGGTGYATGGDASSAAAGTLTPLAIAGLLALGGTKGGQKAINATLFKRYDALKGPTARRRLGKLQGLFGAASVPLMLESGN